MILQQAPLSTWLLLSLVSFTLLSCGDEEVVVEDKMISVTSRALSKVLVEQLIFRPAKANSLNDSILSAELNTTVMKILVDVGGQVQKGQALIELDCKDEQLRLNQAQSQLKASKASTRLSLYDFQRAQKLVKEKSISRQEFDRRKSEYQGNQANEAGALATLQIAENAIVKCVIRAPFDGVIVERKATLGQLTNQGAQMLRIVDTNNLELSSFLSGNEAETLAASSKVYFLQNEKQFPVRLRVISNVVDSMSRTREARLLFTDSLPLSGSSGELVWAHPLPMLPSEYLSERDGVKGVLVLKTEDDKTTVDFIPIKGTVDGQPIPITYSDLITESTAMIVDGRFAVDVGDVVEVVTE